MELVIDIEAWRIPFFVVGVGYLALAAWLLVLDFPSRLNRAFALYLFLDGAGQFRTVLDSSTPAGSALLMESALMNVAAPFALGYFMLTFEERFGSRRWRQRALLPLLTVAVLLAGAVLYEPRWYFGDGLGPIGDLTSWLQVLTPCVAALLFGRQATRHPEDTPRRHALLLASLAFALGPLFLAFHHVVPGIMNASPSEQTSHLVALLPLGLLALHMARVARGDDEKLRNEARRFLVWLAMPMATAILWSATSTAPLITQLWLMSGLMSAWMLALPILITYALVRHRLFDIDVKIRWGISKSTVAAVFIAVFFVASEAAQQFFGDSTGSTYLGIAAAGALVFAIAPLQRAAERLAEKAVPPSDATATDTLHSKEEAYRRALRLMLRDQTLTRDEERDLFLIASELGLSPVRAFELREEVEKGQEVE